MFQALKEFCGKLDEESKAYLLGNNRGLTEKTIKHFGIFCIKDYKTTKVSKKDY